MKHPSPSWLRAIAAAALLSFALGANATSPTLQLASSDGELGCGVKIRAYGDGSGETLYPVEQNVPHRTTEKLNLYIAHAPGMGGLSIINDDRLIPFKPSHWNTEAKWVSFRYKDLTSKKISASMRPADGGAPCIDTFTIPLFFKPLDQ